MNGKLISHKINYVLIVYFFNLFAVSLNLIVYFRNKRLDRLRDAEMAGKAAKP